MRGSKYDVEAYVETMYLAVGVIDIWGRVAPPAEAAGIV
jgi:hypothetical protein